MAFANGGFTAPVAAESRCYKCEETMFNLRTLFHKKKAEQEMDDELRFHREKQIEQNIARGMSAEEAREYGIIDRVIARRSSVTDG